MNYSEDEQIIIQELFNICYEHFQDEQFLESECIRLLIKQPKYSTFKQTLKKLRKDNNRNFCNESACARNGLDALVKRNVVERVTVEIRDFWALFAPSCERLEYAYTINNLSNLL